MSDLSGISDDDLMKMAGLKDRSDEELLQIAGIKTKPENYETVLGRITKSAMNIAQPDIQVNSKFPFIPKISPVGGNILDEGMNLMSNQLEESGHPVAAKAIPLASNLLAGVALGGKPAVKGIGKLGKSLFKPSEAYGEALNKSTGKVNFLDIISKYSDDPTVAKVLKKAKVTEKYGGTSLGEGGSTSEKLANLTAKESQNLINDVKLGKEALLAGKRIRSNEVGLSRFFHDLSKAQTKATGIGGAKKLYGASKNVGKFVKGSVKKIATGSLFGAGAKGAYDLLK